MDVEFPTVGILGVLFCMMGIECILADVIVGSIVDMDLFWEDKQMDREIARQD